MAVEPAAGHIRARLSTFDTAMVVFSLVVGIGIFRTPAIVAGAAGGTSLFFTAWIAGGVISLIGALTFAEIGSRYPRAGGYYRVVADCYDPTFAFMLNWAQTLMQGAGAAGVAFIGADYLMPVLLPPQWRTAHASLILACATMLILLVLNYRGVKPGARLQNLLSVSKIVMIVGLAVLALILAPRAGAAASAPVSAAPAGLRLMSALIPCFYSYGGYQLTMNLGADLKDARRRFPLAISAGMFTVVGLYLLLNFAYQRVLGIGGIAGSKLVAAALSRATFGPFGEVLISIAVFLSAAGFVNATMLLPAFVLGSFDKLLHYVMFTDTLTLAVVASTLFVLRRRHSGDGGFSMPGYPLLPILYIACLLGVAARVFSLEPLLAAAGIAILLTGWPLFRLGHRLFGVESA
jgi:APA family basic amino acid/polyamine antiporter